MQPSWQQVFDPIRVEYALSLHQRGYVLLRWFADAVQSGLISFRAAHTYTSLPAAARSWLGEHYLTLPESGRPPREQLVDFANLFSSYLEGSFDLFEDPGERRYSRHGHCYCPWCTLIAEAPNLQAKKLYKGDKRAADMLQARFLRSVAIGSDITLADPTLDELLADDSLTESLAMATWAEQLFERVAGRGSDPAVLALWRRFAWTKQGSPIPDFQLNAENVVHAAELLQTRLMNPS